jgi:hypothetical protein
MYKQAYRTTKSLWALLGELRVTLFQRPGVEAATYYRRRRRLTEFAARQPGLF